MSKQMAEAFLQAIRDNPEDDTPRLIYADWLEEHGDAARAEFIRVQCEKARLPRWHPRAEILAWREKALLYRHENQWRSELPDIDGVEWLGFDRGFVHEVRVQDVDVLSQRAADIEQASPIRWASISRGESAWKKARPLAYLRGVRLLADIANVYDSPATVLHSPLLATVEHLDLSRLNMEGEQFAVLGRSPHLRNLRMLILDECFMGNGNLRPLAEGEQFRNLTTLSMKGNRYGYHEDARIRPADLAMLADSPNLANLTSLDVSGNEIDVKSLRRLLESPHMANLRELTVAANHLRSDEIHQLAHLPTSTRLHSLSLAHNPIGNGAAEVLAKAAFCTSLMNLDLDTCEITAQGVGELAKAPWISQLCRLNLDNNTTGANGAYAIVQALAEGELAALHLRNNGLDEEAVKLLAASTAAESLLILDLGENDFGEGGMEALATSPHLRQLCELHLERCRVNPESARLLATAAWLPRLSQLTLSNNPLTDRGLAALLSKQGLPGLIELALVSCDLHSQGAEELAGAPLPELRNLDLSGNALGLAGAEALALAPLTTTLVELNLDSTQLQDSAAAALAAGTWPMLRTLSLRTNLLTDAAARVLAAAPNLKHASTIQCQGNRIRYETFRELGSRLRRW
jgi:uncharacterized protein (TIGR02996 family)